VVGADLTLRAVRRIASGLLRQEAEITGMCGLAIIYFRQRMLKTLYRHALTAASLHFRYGEQRIKHPMMGQMPATTF
jgi:hypothetical protein